MKRMSSSRLLWAILFATAVFVGKPAFTETVNTRESLNEQRLESMRMLEDIRKNIVLNEKQKKLLLTEISRLNEDRSVLNKKLITTTTSARIIEKKIQRINTRNSELEESRNKLRQSLLDKNSLLSETLAALQRMGKSPPPALLAAPQDALISIRSAILLGSVILEIRSETSILATQLAQLTKLNQEISLQREQLINHLKMQANEEQRLSFLIEEKKKRFREARRELTVQGVKAVKLAAEAIDLTDLVTRLKSEIEASDTAVETARKAHLDEEKRNAEQVADIRKEISRDNFSDFSRISPAVRFANAKGHLIKPVSGVEIRRFGKKYESGEPSPSLAIATGLNARVISPADGVVAYSGPFRSYGQLLILDVGSDYHIIMSGMKEIDVATGQFVLLGEPVGVMGSPGIVNKDTTDIEWRHPVLTVEFRRGGKPINPAPWWRTNAGKRVTDDS